jgi:hypothetical protein
MFRKIVAALIVIVPCLVSPVFASLYGAIAYSPSTGRHGYTYNYWYLGDAENDALAYCDAPDAIIVAWARNEWCALAVADDKSNYGYASGATQAQAEANALAYCTGPAHIEAIDFSGSD